MSRIDIALLDHQMRFLHGEVAGLQKIQAPWADRKAATMLAIVETLRTIRRDQQMTTIGGKRIEDEQGPPPYRFPAE